MTDTFFGISRRKFTDDELKLLATVVADGVAQQARIDKLERALRDIKLYTEEDYALGRAIAALKEDE